jgi:hypothetical protein
MHTPDAQTSRSPSLTIAGVRFSPLANADVLEFSPSFLSFMGNSLCSDLSCEISVLGPDDSLLAEPLFPVKPWTFTVSNHVCKVIRRNQEGQVLWKFSGSLSFEQAEITWHPILFADFYGSYGQSWNTGLGLSLLVLRLCAHGGLVLHGTAANLDGQGILCVGISGKGKSTLARLLDGAGATVLTDERPVVRQWPAPAEDNGTESEDFFRVYGSPWPSSAGFACNAWAPLKRIYFIEHGATDQITPLMPREAVHRLIHVATIPWQDPALLDPYLATVNRLLQSIPCAVLSFRPTADVVEVIRTDLSRPTKEVSQ